MRSVLPLLAILIAWSARGAETWISANDVAQVRRSGAWQWTKHRYAAESALLTREDGAALEFSYQGRTLVLVFDTLTPPNNYGPPQLGALEVLIDGDRIRTVWPRAEDNEVVLRRTTGAEVHRVKLVHRADGTSAGVRIRGCRVISSASGDLAFSVNGEHHGALIDLRAVVTQGSRMVRDTLARNWLNGQVRIAALPPGEGFTIELRATGWKTWRHGGITIKAGEETTLPPVYLEREWDVPVDEFKFPAFGLPAICRPGDSFRARFQAHHSKIRGARVVRREGPAAISRPVRFEEDPAAAFYYHREGTLTLPADTPSGIYDLEIELEPERAAETLVSRRSVCVVSDFPRDPVFIGFGHLDTWGQDQAEYLSRLVAVANVLGPDMVLVSNEANPAYAAGALYDLAVPFVINFGNHRGPEPGAWFAEPVGMIDFGPDVAVLNFGRPWDADTSMADRLLAARPATRIKIINAFESNAPIAGLLDRHGVSLIHYAHGPGPPVATLGATPTIRVGKMNSESFRIIRFKDGLPRSYTYRGHASAAIPFPRTGPPPIRVNFTPSNNGVHREIRARIENDLEEPLPNARAVFVVPAGRYRIGGGRVELVTESDGRSFAVITTRCEVPAKGSAVITVSPE